MIYDKIKRTIKVISFSSYSYGLFASNTETELVQRSIDYSKIELNVDTDELKGLGVELGEIAVAIESHFGEAQDIEGCINPKDEIYIVQSRNQI